MVPISPAALPTTVRFEGLLESAVYLNQVKIRYCLHGITSLFIKKNLFIRLKVFTVPLRLSTENELELKCRLDESH